MEMDANKNIAIRMMRCDARSRKKIVMPIERHNNSSDGKGSSGAPFFGGRQLLKNDLFLKNENALMLLQTDVASPSIYTNK